MGGVQRWPPPQKWAEKQPVWVDGEGEAVRPVLPTRAAF